MEPTVTIEDVDPITAQLFYAIRLLCTCHKCGGSFLQDLIDKMSGHKSFRDLRCDKCLCKRTFYWLEPALFEELCAQGRFASNLLHVPEADLVLP